jgi:hypothetical protein
MGWLYVAGTIVVAISLTVKLAVYRRGCVFANCAISFIIAEAIPVFGDLISLIGALLATFLAL